MGDRMHYWMVRAAGGKYYNDFIKHDVVAIGWSEIKTNLSSFKNKTEFQRVYKKAYPNDKNNVNAGQVWNFVNVIEKGDVVLTPNPLTKTLYIGKVVGNYQYRKKSTGEIPFRHIRKVEWQKEVSRDAFSTDMKHSIGSLLTLFKIDKYDSEIESALAGSVIGVSAKGRIKFPHKENEEVFMGEPIDFAGLTNAPIEENGVIFLFGKLHEKMGIRIKAIRKGFPDAIGEVWIKDRLYPRTIEFEYKSSNFVHHGHLEAMKKGKTCDIIVCWEHDWKECPKDIFVIELRKEIENYLSE
jgi:hypothetical protein